MVQRGCKERILVVDDSPDTLDILLQNLSSQHFNVVGAAGSMAALELLEKNPFDLLLTDMKMPGMGGLELMKIARERWPDMEVMMITGYATVEGAVEALKTGAEEYLAKPFTHEELSFAVARALTKLRARREARLAARGRFGLVGESEGMRRVFALMERATHRSSPVLILGEAGSGRWAVIQALNSQRGLPPGLIRICDAAAGLSALKPAGFFTAGRAPMGIFLKNLDRAHPDRQQEIHSLLTQNHRGDQFFLTAGPELPLLTRRGLFSEELYNLLAPDAIALPPLRERADDVLLLTEHFAVSLAERLGKSIPRISSQALRTLRSYVWPGNVEELYVALTAAMLRSNGDVVDLEDFPATIRDAAGGVVERCLADAESDHILRVLAHVGGHRGRAAAILGIDRKTLREKLKPLGKALRHES